MTKNFSTGDYYRKLQTSVLLLFIFCFMFVFMPYLIVEANAAENTTVNLAWGKVVLELITGEGGDGNVRFNNGDAITPDSEGKVATVAKTLTVNTSGNHFNVYLSMDSTVGANQKLCYNFSSDQTCSSSSIGIEPVTENGGNPATFSSGSYWGYALNDGETGFSAAGTYDNNSLSGNVISADAANAADAALYEAKWAAVPIATEPKLIWSGDVSGGYNGFGNITYQENDGTSRTVNGDPNNTKTIVYGVKVNNELVAGEYGSKILYTAVASASDLNTPSTNVASSREIGGPTDVTTLYMDVDAEGRTILEGDENFTISLIKHSDAATAAGADGEFTAEEYETAIANKAGTCTKVSNSLKIGEGNLAIDCTLPDLGASSEGVDYDFIVQVPINEALTTKYISYKETSAGAFRYVGLQTKDSSNKYYVSSMQGMTTGICKMTNMWGTGMGTDARVYDLTGTGTPKADSLDGSNAIGVGTFALQDTRDSKEYLVRRLADGNCWMVQNLALELGDFSGTETLTTSNTDLNSTSAVAKGYWDPSESMVSYAKTLDMEATLATYFPTASLGKYGLEQPVQYQAWNQLGNKSKSENSVDYSWGSTKDASGNTLASGENVHDSVYVANNINSQVPRSYSNKVGTKYRYIPTNYTTGARTGYTQQTTGLITDNPLAMTEGLTSSDEANSSHGDSYYNANADGNYYGNMYLGNYYNWYAATAESGVYNSTSTLTVAGSAEDSICPKGWQLPINGPDKTVDSGEFLDKSWVNLIKGSYDLIDAYGTQTVSNNRFSSATEPTNKLQEVPLSIVLSGYYSWVAGTADYRGSSGYYWASTPSSAASARYLGFNSTYVNPQNGNNKVYGFTVRCVAR